MPDMTAAPLGHAPGQPGIPPTWTSSAKDMVGCALDASRIWFTLGFGIVNEVYYPRLDTPQIRDLGFIVADGRGFWSEVKRLENYTLRLLAPGWCAHAPIDRIDSGVSLIIAVPRPARIHWGVNDWQNVRDDDTHDLGLGLHGIELGALTLRDVSAVDFTFQWHDPDGWIGRDFHVAVAGDSQSRFQS